MNYSGDKSPPTPPSQNESWRKPLTYSLVFHGVLITIALIGIPFLPKRTFDEPMSMSVEVVEVSDIARTTKPIASAPEVQKKTEKEKPPAPKQNVEPPKPPQEKPKPEPKPEPKKEEAKKEEPPAPPPPDELAEVKEPPKKEEKKPEPPKKPEPKKEEPKKEAPKKEEKKPDDNQQQDFSSLLKNLQPTEESSPVEVDKSQLMTAPPDTSASSGTLSDRMTMSEMDALRRQLSRCWNILAGAQDAENIVVELKLEVNPDRTVRNATIADQLRYNADSYFKAAADSALRAVRNPLCTPLDLPADKYNQWKSISVRFDPREML